MESISVPSISKIAAFIIISFFLDNISILTKANLVWQFREILKKEKSDINKIYDIEKIKKKWYTKLNK